MIGGLVGLFGVDYFDGCLIVGVCVLVVRGLVSRLL